MGRGRGGGLQNHVEHYAQTNTRALCWDVCSRVVSAMLEHKHVRDDMWFIKTCEDTMLEPMLYKRICISRLSSWDPFVH